MSVEFFAFFGIDTLYYLRSGIFAVLPLIYDVDCCCSRTSFVHISFLAAQMQTVTFHYRMPCIGMIRHGVEQHAVHVEKNGFQPDIVVSVFS